MKLRLFRPLLALSVLLVAATSVSPARSATLDLTGSDLSLRLWFGAEAVVATQETDPLSVSVSSGGGFSVPAGQFVHTTGTTIFAPPGTQFPTGLFTGVPLLSSLRITLSNALESFGPGNGPGGGFGGSGSLQGSVIFGVLGGLVQLQPSLDPVGVGGSELLQAASLAVLATGGAWTTGAAIVTGVSFQSAGGAFFNTASLSGADGRTAAHAGTLRLVAPMRILSNAGLNVPLFFTQTLRFVPEPGTALLFGVAAIFAGWMGIRRRA